MLKSEQSAWVKGNDSDMFELITSTFYKKHTWSYG